MRILTLLGPPADGISSAGFSYPVCLPSADCLEAIPYPGVDHFIGHADADNITFTTWPMNQFPQKHSCVEAQLFMSRKLKRCSLSGPVESRPTDPVYGCWAVSAISLAVNQHTPDDIFKVAISTKANLCSVVATIRRLRFANNCPPKNWRAMSVCDRLGSEPFATFLGIIIATHQIAEEVLVELPEDPVPGGLKYFQTKFAHFSGPSLFIMALTRRVLTWLFVSGVPEASVTGAKRQAQDQLAVFKSALIHSNRR